MHLLHGDLVSFAVSGVYFRRVETQASHPGKPGDDVGRQRGMTLTAKDLSCAEQLARFFPKLAAVRIPVHVTALRGGTSRLQEATVVEFATGDHAIFLSTLPLEFDERVRLERDRKGHAADATVIALQYHEGRKAVAVRFLQGPCDWMMQP